MLIDIIARRAIKPMLRLSLKPALSEVEMLKIH